MTILLSHRACRNAEPNVAFAPMRIRYRLLWRDGVATIWDILKFCLLA